MQDIRERETDVAELERVHRCQFCGKTFARKSWFQRHLCAKKRKFEETNDVVVQQAFRVYVFWLREAGLLKKKHNPDFDKFLKSPYKRSFVNLIMYTREQGFVSPYTYVEWLIAKRIPEPRWTSEETKHLDAFREYVGMNEDPEEQSLATMRNIENWILELPEERNAKMFFDRLSAGSILTLVRKRFIKPWPLFVYPPIADKWLADDTHNRDVFYRIDDIVNCNYWADKMTEEPESEDIVIQTMDQLWEFQM